MKTDISVDSKARSDGRQGLSRRRVARDHSSRSSENWAFDQNDLALAVQESLRYAKQAEKQKTLLEQNQNRKSDSGMKSKREDMIITDKNCGESSQLTQGPKQLKELLLIHIDLAQHQQELLIQKDKEIKSLKEERNALSCRLDRMERRMSLLKQKEDGSEAQSNHRTVSSPCNVYSFHETAASAPPERSMKRKYGSGLLPQNLNKRFAAEAHKECQGAVTSQRTERQQNRPRGRPATVTCSAGSSTDVPPAFLPSQKKNRRSTKNVKDSQVDNSVLRTKDNYFVSYYEPASSADIDLECRGDIIRGAQSQLEVELPTWRNRTYTKLWVLEGTENLEDEIFLKRHQKPEVEEKRRKRWDLQRIREQKIYEKLKEKDKERGGEVYTSQQKEDDAVVESFYSDLENITHIEVTDKIPVMAFGHPVPNVDQIEFNLPWELESTATSHNSRSVSRSGRSR